MNAHDLVDEMCDDLEEKFGLSGGQVFRVVSHIGRFNYDPIYEEMAGENGVGYEELMSRTNHSNFSRFATLPK